MEKLLTEINKELNLLLWNITVPWFIKKYITLILNSKKHQNCANQAPTEKGFPLAVKFKQTPDLKGCELAWWAPTYQLFDV